MYKGKENEIININTKVPDITNEKNFKKQLQPIGLIKNEIKD